MKKRKLVPYLLLSSLVLSSISGSVIVFAESAFVENGSELAGEQEVPTKTDEENRAVTPKTGKSGTCSWELDSDGVLTIGAGTLGDRGTTPDNEATKIIFDGPIVLLAGNSRFMGSTAESYENIENLDMSKVESMRAMFKDNKNLKNIDLSHMDTSKLTDLYGMFQYCSSLETINLDGFNTSKVINFAAMFSGCSSLTALDLTSFDMRSCGPYGWGSFIGQTSNMKTLTLGEYTGIQGTSLPDIDTTSNLYTGAWIKTDGSKIFKDSKTFMNEYNQQTDAGTYVWETTEVSPVTVNYVDEAGAELATSDTLIGELGEDYTTSAKDITGYMLKETPANATGTFTTFNQTVTYVYERPKWGTCPWVLEDGVLTIESGNLVKGTNSSTATVAGIKKADVSKVVFKGDIVADEDSSSLFSNWSNLETIEGIENLDTSKVTNMNSMFYKCSSLTSFDTSHFDTSKVTNMQDIFSNCSSLTELDSSGLNTSQAIQMNGMFEECTNLKNLDVSQFTTTSVTTMKGMFNKCTSLTSLNLSGFDTSNVTNMTNMLGQTTNLTTLSLGSKFTFGENTNLPEIEITSVYTGKWASEESEKTFSSSTDLMSTYSGATDAGTYTWEVVKAAPVTVNYVDTVGNTLAESEVLTGELGASFESEAKTIKGYALKETPENATGIFTEEAQTVTFVYKKNAKPFAVNYVGVQQQQVVGFVPEGVKTSQVSLLIKKDGTDEWVDTGYTATPAAETGYFAIESRFVKDTRDFLLNNKDQIKVAFTDENGENYEGVQVVQPYTAPIVDDFTEGDEYLTGSVPNGANQVRISVNGKTMRVVNNGPIIEEDAGINAVTGAFSIWAKTWFEGLYGSSPIQQTKAGDVITVDYGVQIYGDFNNPSTTIIVK
ncbi:MAG: BspA family leucine-rich repeat surface protein [Carnobacterium maltaromaticum]